MTVKLHIKDVAVPGIATPVSGEVDFLPAQGGTWGSPPEGAEIIDCKLKDAEGIPVTHVPLPASYWALLDAACEAYDYLLAEAYASLPE
jgi:hypothetical protein